VLLAADAWRALTRRPAGGVLSSERRTGTRIMP
jgi:hypothetical protein